MKTIALFTFYLFIFSPAFSQKEYDYTVKYRVIFSKDSSRLQVKSDDIMLLRMNNNRSLYYSYLRQLGEKNQHDHFVKTVSENNSGIVDLGKSLEPVIGSFFLNNETEILELDYENFIYTSYEKFPVDHSFKFVDTLVQPTWTLGSQADTILGQYCQVATTTYKGRNYIAWFAPGIPYAMGPWLLNGLPGLILKVKDDRGQYSYECIELNTGAEYTNIFSPYKNPKTILKGKLYHIKKLYKTDYITFEQQISGGNITVSTASGNATKMNPKPYNPPDITLE